MNTLLKKPTFDVGKMATFTESWSPTDRPKLVFHSGTSGKVEQLLDGEVRLQIPVPHAPPITINVPHAVLQRG